MEQQKISNFKLLTQLLVVMVITSLLTIAGSATLVGYLSEPIVEKINITAPLSLQHSIDGTTWNNDEIVFNGHSGDTISFYVRLQNFGDTNITANINASITCVEGITIDDFQSINATVNGTEYPIKSLFQQYNATTIILCYNVVVRHADDGTKTYLAGINMTLATNAVGHYTVNSQVFPI